MTLDHAVHLLEANGCAVVKSEGRAVLIRDPKDHRLWLTDDPETYTPVATHLFADKVKPYPIDEDARHVLGESNICADVSEMTTALGMVSEYDADFDEIMQGGLRTADEPYPLWVQHSDGSLTPIGEDRLRALQDGTAAETEIERLLVENPDWFSTYLDEVLGQYCVVLTDGEPLPKWDADWLRELKQQQTDGQPWPELEDEMDLGILDELTTDKFNALVDEARQGSAEAEETLVKWFMASMARCHSMDCGCGSAETVECGSEEGTTGPGVLLTGKQ